jgi:RHS repeat-associated protein
MTKKLLTLSKKKDKKQKGITPLPEGGAVHTERQEMGLRSTATAIPMPPALLTIEVYNSAGVLQSAQTQNVTEAGATTWEELSIGVEIKQGGYIIAKVSNTDGSMPTRFDDLKIEVFNAPVAMVVQENSYYPFGLNMRGLDYVLNASKEDKFQYNGKEKENDFGLGWDDFGARRRDRDRFTSIDPLAEKFYSISPYVYALNNPLRYTDPDGKAPSDIIILNDPKGAGKTGHGAVLIGSQSTGWTYISKDGFKDSAFGGKSKYIKKEFATLDAFRNSVHNFVVTNESGLTNGENGASQNFALNDKGEKIQRYEFGYMISTSKETDKNAIAAAEAEAIATYCLTNGDCSDVVSSALTVSKTPDGKPIWSGDSWLQTDMLPILGWGLQQIPRLKYAAVTQKNNGAPVNDWIRPDNFNLQNGEKGKKEEKKNNNPYPEGRAGNE